MTRITTTGTVDWQPTPFREFILKVAGRCDLDCDYCYMFTMAGQDWRDQPRFMSDAVVDAVAQSIGTHAARHRQTAVTVILHGGEPLLAGAPRLARIAAMIRARVPPSIRVDVSVQTNGVLLDEPALSVLGDAGIRVAVSLDGDANSHNRHRRYRNGTGSYDDVVQSLRLLDRPDHRTTFAGILCVVDLANEPATVYDALASYSPPAMDFLLPFGNWTCPPPGRPADDSAPYGRWLAAAFDTWYAAPPGRPEVRLFRDLITLLIGGRSRSEHVGLSPAAMVVFNLDGSIEQVDSLRSAYPGAVGTGLSALVHELEEALAHPDIRARQLGIAALAADCQGCHLVRVCGGGHHAHRYRQGSGFRNRSVYCADLVHLIGHVRARIEHDVAVLRNGTR